MPIKKAPVARKLYKKPTVKKHSVILVASSKYSKSAAKISKRLQELLPEYKVACRLDTRPDLEQNTKRSIFQWNGNLNKLQQFRLFEEHNIPCPEFTTDAAVAREWVGHNNTVVGRRTLTGFGGAGIVLYEPGDTIPNNHGCQMFTKYKKKRHEFRLHVFNGKLIDFAQKRKSTEANNNNNVNTKIRNHENGWVYCRENVVLPADAVTLAIDAVETLGLHHGAVDLIWNEAEDKSYILEVNSAPGLEGSTVDKYALAFKELIVPSKQGLQNIDFPVMKKAKTNPKEKKAFGV